MKRRLVLFGLVATPVLAWLGLRPRTLGPWTSFTEARIEPIAFRKGDVLTGPDGQRWVADVMPSGQCGLRRQAVRQWA